MWFAKTYYTTENKCNVYDNVVKATKQVVHGITLIILIFSNVYAAIYIIINIITVTIT